MCLFESRPKTFLNDNHLQLSPLSSSLSTFFTVAIVVIVATGGVAVEVV